jgi:hypothetical protein
MFLTKKNVCYRHLSTCKTLEMAAETYFVVLKVLHHGHPHQDEKGKEAGTTAGIKGLSGETCSQFINILCIVLVNQSKQLSKLCLENGGGHFKGEL